MPSFVDDDRLSEVTKNQASCHAVQCSFCQLKLYLEGAYLVDGKHCTNSFSSSIKKRNVFYAP